MTIPWFYQLWGGEGIWVEFQTGDWCLRTTGVRVLGGRRGGRVSLLRRGGLLVDACATVQILVLKGGAE